MGESTQWLNVMGDPVVTPVLLVLKLTGIYSNFLVQASFHSTSLILPASGSKILMLIAPLALQAAH